MALILGGGLAALVFSYSIGRRLGMDPILAPFSLVLWVVLGTYLVHIIGGHL